MRRATIFQVAVMGVLAGVLTILAGLAVPRHDPLMLRWRQATDQETRQSEQERRKAEQDRLFEELLRQQQRGQTPAPAAS